LKKRKKIKSSVASSKALFFTITVSFPFFLMTACAPFFVCACSLSLLPDVNEASFFCCVKNLAICGVLSNLSMRVFFYLWQ
jgi:hypothetical protein